MILKPNEAMMSDLGTPCEATINSFPIAARVAINGVDLVDLLEDLEEYLGNYADVDDGHGNEAARLLYRVEQALAGMARNAPQSTAMPSVPSTGHIVPPGEQNASTGVYQRESASDTLRGDRCIS